MSAVTILGMLAFLLCLLFTPICRDLAIRFNLLDQPDTERRHHASPVPRVGGVAIVLSYGGALGLMFLLAPHASRIYIQHSKLMLSLLLPAGIVFCTGLVDDIVGLKPWQKLSGQLFAASIAVAFGARVAMLHGLPTSAWITVPFSLVWIIGCTNAVNLIDGMDGLASGVGLFATLATLTAALINGNVGLAMATVPLAGCLLAFLRYNFSPATIFLGDCGSLTIGFMLGCFGLIWSHHGGTLFGMALPVTALALPLLDALLAIGRRRLRKVPIFKGDRGHIHHMILARGVRPNVAAMILYAFCAFAAVFALLQTFIDLRVRAPIYLIFAWLIWAALNYLGYIELQSVKKIFSRKHLMVLLRTEISLEDLKRVLDRTETIEEFWEVTRKACAERRFSSVRMVYGGLHFSNVFRPDSPESLLTMMAHFRDGGRLEVTHTERELPGGLLSFISYVQKSADGHNRSLSTSKFPHAA